MDVQWFDFELPEELIAQTPLPDRTGSRLLALDKETGAIEHTTFRELKRFLRPGDTLILNDTRVIPARLIGIKPDTGGQVELLLLKSLGDDRWQTLAKPAKRLKPGATIVFGKQSPSEGDEADGILAGSSGTAAAEPLLTAVVEQEGEMGERIVRFSYEGVFLELLDRLGQMPLPPYIRERLDDRDRYQTVYAREAGSAAAPTAGLHFTQQLLQEMRDSGISVGFVTLHVGLGTFRPVSAERVEEHTMHAEYYELPPETAELVNRTKRQGGRVVAVGTTSARTLEAAAAAYAASRSTSGPAPAGDDAAAIVQAGSGWTDIYIYPGYRFRAVDALLTNFHLPKSTLVMLVSALAGRDPVMEAYRQAVERKYRFFSFGDAMLIHASSQS